jgi:hypothetical protein
LKGVSTSKEGTKMAEQTKKLGKGIGIFDFIVFALTSVIVTVSTLVVYDRYFAQRIAYLDIKAYMEDQRGKYLAQKITDEQLSKNIDHIKEVVDRLPKNIVLLVNLPAPPNGGNSDGYVVVKNAAAINLDK